MLQQQPKNRVELDNFFISIFIFSKFCFCLSCCEKFFTNKVCFKITVLTLQIPLIDTSKFSFECSICSHKIINYFLLGSNAKHSNSGK